MEMTLSKSRDSTTLVELDFSEIDQVSGGVLPAVIAAATAVIMLGNSSLDFGRNLGASIYRITR